MQSKTIFITGAAKRIGAGIATHYAKQGCRIVIHYNESESEAIKLSERLATHGAQIMLIQADFSQPYIAEEVFSKIATEFTELDLLINNASTFIKDTIDSIDIESFDRNMNINLRTPVLLTSQYQKKFSKGHIINILDTAISTNRCNQISYLLSKKALADFTKIAALAIAPNFRVNAIAPGWLSEPIHGRVLTAEQYEQSINAIPLERKGSEADIITAIDMLDALTYATGQILFISGGKHLLSPSK